MCLVFRVSIFGLVVGKGKVVDTIPVPVGMYRIGTYTNIKMSTFRTDLNTSHVPTILVNFKFYWLVPSVSVGIEFFFFFLVLSFLNFYKGKMVIYFALTY